MCGLKKHQLNFLTFLQLYIVFNAVIFTTPAQVLYQTGGTFADGFWEVDLINATNGRSENLHRVRAAEWEPAEEKHEPPTISSIYNWRN